MGCFDSSCVVSGLPVHYTNDSAMMMIIEKSHYKNGDMNKGPFEYWNPIAFPFKGKYNDYGKLVNIEKDRNVEIVEEYFGTDVETIQQIIHDLNGDEDFQYLHLSDTIFRVYGNKTFVDHYYLTRNTLENLGCVIDSDNNVTHPWLTKYAEHYKGDLSQYGFKFIEGVQKHECVISFTSENDTLRDYTIRDYNSLNSTFNQILGKMNQFHLWNPFILGLTTNRELVEKIKLLARCSVAFIDTEIYDKVVDIKEDNIYYKKRFDDSFNECLEHATKKVELEAMAEQRKKAGITREQWTEEERNEWSLIHFDGNDRYKRLFCYFSDMAAPNIYKHKLPTDKDYLYEKLIEFNRFTLSLFWLNVLVNPTRSFSQYGDLEMQNKYRKVIGKVFRKRHKKHKEDYGE